MSVWKYKDHWYCQVMHLGKYYRGGKGYDKKEEAMEAQAQIKYKLKITRTLSKTHVTSQDNSFEPLWKRYLIHCEAYNSKAWFDAKRYIGSKYFRKWFNEDITQIMPADIEAHLVERKGLSARSANLDFEILRNFYRWCVEMGFLDKSPMLYLRKFPLAKKIRVIPTREDVETLISTNKGTDRLLILLLVYTMGRISEIRGLQWKDVDLNKKVLYLRTRKTGDGSESIREIPINGTLLQYFLSNPVNQTEGFVLSSNANGGPYKDLRKKLKKCLEMAGIQTFGFHAFRHYGISRLIEAGVDPATVRDIAGHATLEMTSHYSHSSTENKRRAMEMM